MQTKRKRVKKFPLNTLLWTRGTVLIMCLLFDTYGSKENRGTETPSINKKSIFRCSRSPWIEKNIRIGCILPCRLSQRTPCLPSQYSIAGRPNGLLTTAPCEPLPVPWPSLAHACPRPIAYPAQPQGPSHLTLPSMTKSDDSGILFSSTKEWRKHDGQDDISIRK